MHPQPHDLQSSFCLATPHPSCHLLQSLPSLYSHPLNPSSFLVIHRFTLFNFLVSNPLPPLQPLSLLSTLHPSCLLQPRPPLYSPPLNPSSSFVTHRFTLFNFLLLLLI